MSTLHQISFYHQCGHTEDCIWVTPGGNPHEILTDILSLVQQIDPDSITRDVKHKLDTVPFYSSSKTALQWQIDAVRIMNEADESSSGNAVEFHYQKRMCCYCDKSLDLGISPVHLRLPDLDSDTLQYRCDLWRSLVDNFTTDAWGEQKRQAEIVLRMLKVSLATLRGKNKQDNRDLSKVMQDVRNLERQIQNATYYTMEMRDGSGMLYNVRSLNFSTTQNFTELATT